MFERFTDRARRVLVLAQESSRELGHSWLGTEHELLGLALEGEGVAAVVLGRAGIGPDGLRLAIAERLPPAPTLGDAANALAAVGIDLDAVRAEVDGAFGLGALRLAPSGDAPPFTPLAKQCLEEALQAALGLGHDYIGTEHLLLGLLSLESGIARELLVERGVDPAALSTETVRVVTRLGAVPPDEVRPERLRLGRGVVNLPDELRGAGMAALGVYDAVQNRVMTAAIDLPEDSFEQGVADLQLELRPALDEAVAALRQLGVLPFVEIASDPALSEELRDATEARSAITKGMQPPDVDPVDTGRRRRAAQQANELIRAAWRDVWDQHAVETRDQLATRFTTAASHIRQIAATISEPASA